MDEKVDILLPPTFEPSGIVKTKRQAIEAGDWIGTFNLWIVQRQPVPAMVYQMRSPRSNWAPNKLDVTVGGHYQAGEKLADGLREVQEELGRHFEPQEVTYLGRKIYVGPDTTGRTRNNVVEVYVVEDDSPINSYKLEVAEVYALCVCPLEELLKTHHDSNYSFTTKSINNVGNEAEIQINCNSFPYNWDNYHYKMAVLADRLLKGEKDLAY
jgi:8-oxo-dGTP pyrophosphatase MutT (NUDIX family)